MAGRRLDAVEDRWRASGRSRDRRLLTVLCLLRRIERAKLKTTVSFGNRRRVLYTFGLMFTQRVKLKKTLTGTLSVCLLGMLLGCVAICAKHLEDSLAADAHELCEPCDDEDCPMTASAAIILPERFFLSPGFDDYVSQHPPVFHVELISCGRARRLPFYSSLDPPLERLCVLRI
jgi:hypothetical protein